MIIIFYIEFQYTREDIEWYGLTYDEAAQKLILLKRADSAKIEPLKVQYRAELLAALKESQLKKAEKEIVESSGSWISKVNPFAQKPKA